jgi:hypothetical protein
VDYSWDYEFSDDGVDFEEKHWQQKKN